jgi:hypothetical protein
MSRSAIPLALATVALVAACAYPATPAPAPVAVAATPAPVVVPAAPAQVVVVPQPAPAVVAAPAPQTVVVPQPAALRPGTGRVESITAIPASSGAYPTSYGTIRRLGIKMNDGTVQYVDSEVPNVAVGDRVELTANGYILHPI